ncbi:hypothetical protein LZ30DRAFT_358012 [Colletotrichum cereale]|nr:hypothetical protein LZ30DRAFT_358012 [Colletotrichum cereale]
MSWGRIPIPLQPTKLTFGPGGLERRDPRCLGRGPRKSTDPAQQTACVKFGLTFRCCIQMICTGFFRPSAPAHPGSSPRGGSPGEGTTDGAGFPTGPHYRQLRAGPPHSPSNLVGGWWSQGVSMIGSAYHYLAGSSAGSDMRRAPITTPASDPAVREEEGEKRGGGGKPFPQPSRVLIRWEFALASILVPSPCGAIGEDSNARPGWLRSPTRADQGTDVGWRGVPFKRRAGRTVSDMI